MTIAVLMGVSGSGKTTVGRLLARHLGWTFVEGDDFHPTENVARMARGEPLTESDREPWLDALRAHLATLAARGEDAVVASSALSRAARARLTPPGVTPRWVHLSGDRDTLHERLATRRGHFMKAVLLESQLEALEPPDERPALTVDVRRTPEELVEEIAAQLRSTA